MTLTNQGANALPNLTLAISGTNSGDFALNSATTCGSSLAAGSPCLIAVTFTPSATGTRSATLSVGYGGIGSPQSVTLTGTGQSLTITSTVAQLVAGTTYQFTSSPASVAVTWTASCGSCITASGFFTAPTTAGIITITATSTASSQVVATDQVTIAPAPAITVPSPITLTEGQTQNVPISIGAGTGIAGESYMVACTPTPTVVTCLFNPNPLVDAAGGASGMLALTSDPLSSKLPEHRLPGNGFPIGGPVTALACFALFRIRRRLPRIWLILVAGVVTSAAMLSISGCGTNGVFKTGSQQGLVYAPGTYAIKVAVTGATPGAPDFNQTVGTVTMNVTITQ